MADEPERAGRIRSRPSSRRSTTGSTCPIPSRYYSREFMQLEWERLWPRVWLLAGVTSDIPEAGDYFVFEIGARGDSWWCARQSGGSRRSTTSARIAATASAQRARQRASDSRAPSTAGSSTATASSSASPTRRRSIRSSSRTGPGLSEVRCDAIGGLIFVNMDGKAPPLREWLGLPPGYIENYEIDKMHAVRHVRSEWLANWKTGVDAFYETYHLPHIHPQTQTVMEDFSQHDLYPNGFEPHDRAALREVAPRGGPGERGRRPAAS